MFIFRDFDYLTDGEIDLIIREKRQGIEEKNYLPAYLYTIKLHGQETEIGEIDIRIGHNHNTYFGGNIGYEIKEEYRGHYYAAKACMLIKTVAAAHDLSHLIITCNPENTASRKTILKVGASFKGIETLPSDNEMYLAGEKEKCIYEWNLIES